MLSHFAYEKFPLTTSPLFNAHELTIIGFDSVKCPPECAKAAIIDPINKKMSTPIILKKLKLIVLFKYIYLLSFILIFTKY